MENNMGSQAKILETIVDQRRKRLREGGHAQGMDLPAVRATLPLPFPDSPFLLCEVKRRSPSAGIISDLPDSTIQVDRYKEVGVKAVSVLTEEDFFGGSLRDLMNIKGRNPWLFVLRKDFLLEPEDIEISYRAGADAVLLIAGILEKEELAELYGLALSLGLSVLVEVHSREEIEKIRPFRPETVGINARDLRDFSIDLLAPLRLRGFLDWTPRRIFESGIRAEEDAALAFSAGFDGVLVGEAVMRDPGLLPKLREARRFYPGAETPDAAVPDIPDHQDAPNTSKAADPPRGAAFFWSSLFGGRLGFGAADFPPDFHAGPPENRNSLTDRDSSENRNSPEDPDYPGTAAGRPARPLVKICGLTNSEDVRLAEELGADILGFVLAPSPRRASPELIRGIGRTRARKVGVVVSEPKASRLPPEVEALLREGALDAIQFHGDEEPEECFPMAFPYYKALRIRDEQSVERVKKYRSPRVLADAFSTDSYGGSGRNIDPALVELLRKEGPLWLAGGIGPGNVGRILKDYRPELIDASSQLEVEPGKKDPEKMRKFFAEIDAATHRGGPAATFQRDLTVMHSNRTVQPRRYNAGTQPRPEAKEHIK